MTDTEKTTLKLIKHGEKTIQVDAAEYAEAKRDEWLPEFLDSWTSSLDGDVTIVESDGERFALAGWGEVYSDLRGEVEKLAVLRNLLEKLAGEYERAASDARAKGLFVDAQNYEGIARDLHRVMDGAQ